MSCLQSAECKRACSGEFLIGREWSRDLDTGLWLAPAVVSSLYIGSLVLAGLALSVILNVRYFDKNSAKCGIKYIKSILNTAILYYISPLSHTRMFTQFFVWSYFVDSRKIKFYWCHWDLSCSGAEVFLLKCFVFDKWAMTFPLRRSVMRT